MATPGPGWRADVFLYRSAEEKGVLSLAWKRRYTRVMYANAHTRRSTPWHWRWEVSPEQSKAFVDRVRVKEQLTRVVYMDCAGQEANVQPLYISLWELADLFVGIDFKGGAVALNPLSAIGSGFEYTSDELAKIRMTIKRRCDWAVLERMRSRFYVCEFVPIARL